MRLITAVENFILFSTLLAVCSFAIAVAVRLSAERGWRRWQPETQAGIYSTAAISPPFAAAWLTAAAFLPEWWLGETTFDAAHPQPLHQLHLLGELTARLEPTLAYAIVSLIAVSFITATWFSLRGYLRLNNLIERLDATAQPPSPQTLGLIQEVSAQSGMQIGLVMSDHPFSFVWGFHRSRLVLSSGLLNALPAAARTGCALSPARPQNALDCPALFPGAARRFPRRAARRPRSDRSSDQHSQVER